MFIGVDCSTQSVKLQLIDERQNKVHEVVVEYDKELPHYATVNGVIRHVRPTTTADNIEHISTPTLLFVEALEVAMAKLAQAGANLSRVKAISGSGQQHGSVWWRTGSSQTLAKLHKSTAPGAAPLVDLFKDSFALPLSPIWMDNSTSVECEEITAGLRLLVFSLL